MAIKGRMIRKQSYAGLQVGQELLGETVGDRPIMQCRRVGHILGYVETRTHLVFLIHILTRVQVVSKQGD
jgi:hypothetical protein